MMKYEKRHNEKLTFRDYIALMKMSMRGWIWRHEGDSFVQRLRNSETALAWAIIWYFILGFAIGGAFMIVRSVIALFFSIFTKASLVAVELCIFNPKKLIENFGFANSAWWNNTGVHPTEITEDPGLYGEYVATRLIEGQLKKSNIYGKIYNSLMVPMRNHDIDTYSEADIVTVTEMGIHVFEVKNQRGVFSGHYNYKTWFKDNDYTADPPYGNPMKQNQNHINYIIEYLYPRLKEAGLLNNEVVLNDYFLNIVLFTDNRYTGVNLDFSDMPNGTGFFFSGGQEDTRFDINKAGTIAKPTRQQIDFICGLFDKLSDVTLQQHAAMVAEKVYNDSQMEYSWEYRASFKAAMCRCNGEGAYPYVARSNGNYTWFDFNNENHFWAFPELEITHSIDTGTGDDGYNKAKETVDQWKASLGQQG